MTEPESETEEDFEELSDIERVGVPVREDDSEALIVDVLPAVSDPVMEGEVDGDFEELVDPLELSEVEGERVKEELPVGLAVRERLDDSELELDSLDVAELVPVFV